MKELINLDYSTKIEINSPKTKTILTASFLLSRDDIRQAIAADEIHINGKRYKVPIEQLSQLLTYEVPALIHLSLELIETP